MKWKSALLGIATLTLVSGGASAMPNGVPLEPPPLTWIRYATFVTRGEGAGGGRTISGRTLSTRGLDLAAGMAVGTADGDTVGKQKFRLHWCCRWKFAAGPPQHRCVQGELNKARQRAGFSLAIEPGRLANNEVLALSLSIVT